MSTVEPIPALLPYVLLLACVVAWPSLDAAARGRFNLFHPLTFAAWSYWLPGFVVSGLLIATGAAPRLFYWSLIPDPERDLTATLLYLTLGFAALIAGFACPWERWLPAAVHPHVARWQWTLRQVFVPAVCLIAAGAAVNVLGIAVGALGYQTGDRTLIGTLYFAAMHETFGAVVLWTAVFADRTADPRLRAASIGVLLASTLLRVLLAGARGPLVYQTMLIAGAYCAAGRRIRPRTLAGLGAIGVVMLLLGFVYGSTYREVKQTEAVATLDEQLTYIQRTFEVVGDRSVADNLTLALQRIVERVDIVSQVAVIVANHERMRAFEESAGLSDSIWRAAAGAFIPRVFWPDKPNPSDPRAFAALYYGYGDNSFAVSVVGDLVRNGGALAVALGMFAVGLFLRLIHALLWLPPSIGGRAAYLLLLTTLTYEGFFGPLLPTAVRTAVVIAVGVTAIQLYTRLTTARTALA